MIRPNFFTGVTSTIELITILQTKGAVRHPPGSGEQSLRFLFPVGLPGVGGAVSLGYYSATVYEADVNFHNNNKFRYTHGIILDNVYYTSPPLETWRRAIFCKHSGADEIRIRFSIPVSDLLYDK